MYLTLKYNVTILFQCYNFLCLIWADRPPIFFSCKLNQALHVNISSCMSRKSAVLMRVAENPSKGLPSEVFLEVFHGAQFSPSLYFCLMMCVSSDTVQKKRTFYCSGMGFHLFWGWNFKFKYINSLIFTGIVSIQ